MNNLQQASAKRDFEDARRRAAVQRVLASLRGQSSDLLSFDEIHEQLGPRGSQERGLQEIPLDAIVGSVGRHRDFTRTFLPRHADDEGRWARLKTHIDRRGMDPITVYKLGEAYFVIDGNHRVSIARQRGDKTIQAYVTEIETRVALDPDDSTEQIICKARYAAFLEKTELDDLRPGADLLMSMCGYYQDLLDQIETEHYLLQLDPKRQEVPYSEAVTRWYDRVYLPLVSLARRLGLARHFPGRTETDLYVMLTKHRAELRQDLDWHVDMAAVADDLTRRQSGTAAQVGERVLEAITPAVLESGPDTGRWRRERLSRRPSSTLFSDILVAGRGLPADLNMVRHAAIIARREQSRLLALRLVADDEGEESA
ncbi:MAG: ParB N-terminal domain-containing protein, partial [Candidatus Promineifilaceae bacterium]|nr:ParB N-terminal domain-containing protein [Candidatus Promineifilaceae bacterium]